ncbi:helix-turn-helix domain-containing protein [Kribbella sp. NPDC051770]|uniref:TetR/AcrR family transcriptional regulator n=1 Tax=Kribbella sp. NPDC051770 TaxID=3155413 RepID=UPI00343566BE
MLRTDAARNADAVLATAARLLAENPSVSMAEIGRAAGVDRSTVYRRFPSRDALVAAMFEAKLDAAQQAIDEARVETAPFAVAVHRFLEEMIRVGRRWPVDMSLMLQDAPSRARHDEQRTRIERLVERGIRDGDVRGDLPTGWACDVLLALLDLAIHQYEDIEPGPAADLVMDSFLNATATGR